MWKQEACINIDTNGSVYYLSHFVLILQSFSFAPLFFSVSFLSSLPFPSLFSAFEYNDYVRSVDGSAFKTIQVFELFSHLSLLFLYFSPLGSLTFFACSASQPFNHSICQILFWHPPSLHRFSSNTHSSLCRTLRRMMIRRNNHQNQNLLPSYLLFKDCS